MTKNTDTPEQNSDIAALSDGVNQSGLRDYNERLLLSMIQRTGGMPGSELAKRASLSPQTVSVILRKLEKIQLIKKGEPVRGKVGKPSTPMQLNPDGAYSVGLNIGRRGANMVLMDLVGTVRFEKELRYPYPTPKDIFGFLTAGLDEIHHSLKPSQRKRITGIGIAMPFEIWKWTDLLGAPEDAFADWKHLDVTAEIAAFSDLPVLVLNDATAACHAEHVFGRGREYRDFAYFFVGAFIGGGIVMNNAVIEGNRQNAGALGAMRVTGSDGTPHALIDTASIFILEEMLAKSGIDYAQLHEDPESWHTLADSVIPWVRQTGTHIAQAARQACCVIDFETIFVDGAFPKHVRDSIVAHARAELERLDMRGVIAPSIEQGAIGTKAREIGAASSLMYNQYFMNANGGLKSV